jgi:hypothetical protein
MGARNLPELVKVALRRKGELATNPDDILR